jgi:hypothetical protein
VRELEGVRVDSVSDRTFLMHKGSNIEVNSKLPLKLKARDDLSMAYIVPSVFNRRVAESVAEAVAAVESGVALRERAVRVRTRSGARAGRMRSRMASRPPRPAGWGRWPGPCRH